MSNETTPKIGWIGAGRMGVAMSRRLLAAGHDVTVTNRTRSKAEALVAEGATVADSPADLADCDVVFIMVAGPTDLVEVISGPNGLLSGTSTPRVVVDCSTVSMEASADVRAMATDRGAAFLAAPVSGNPKVVAAGKLTLAVSGPRSTYDDLEPLLELFGHGVTYVGEGELARLVKICHNVFLGVVIQSLAEITVLAERGGIKRAAFLEFMNNSVLGSDFSRYKSPALVNLDFTPTFTPPLLRKDFDLGLAEARAMEVPMPLAALCAQIIGSAIGAGYREEDFATLILEQARSAGMELVPEHTKVSDGLEVSAG